MDGRGRWMDNVFIERLWRSLKYEDVYLKGYADGRDAKAGIAAWMTFYNHQRPSPGAGQSSADGGVARRRHRRERRNGCGYDAALGQRKGVAHMPTEATEKREESGLKIRRGREQKAQAPSTP